MGAMVRGEELADVSGSRDSMWCPLRPPYCGRSRFTATPWALPIVVHDRRTSNSPRRRRSPYLMTVRASRLGKNAVLSGPARRGGAVVDSAVRNRIDDQPTACALNTS